MTWYVRTQQGTKAQGPFTGDKIVGYIEAGRVRPEMWFSQDGETWEQRPAALFPPAAPAPTRRQAPPREAPAPAPARRQAAARTPEPPPRRRREPDPYDDDQADDFSRAAPRRSPIPWVFAAVTTVLLLFALGLDQWATTRLVRGEGRNKSELALHFGREAMVVAVDVAGNERAVAFGQRRYEEMFEADSTARPMADKTILYGHLLLYVTLLAVAVRILGAFLVWRDARFAGGASSVYVLGTALVAAVFVVALLFNDGGALSAMSSASSLLGDASTGFGFSAWVALIALVMDAFGILAIKAALTPRRRPPPRRRSRQIR